MSGGADSPFPYCQQCRRWMEDETKLRFRYQPASTAVADRFAQEIVAGHYEVLGELGEIAEPKEKGLEFVLFSCGKNHAYHVLNLTWFRETPDPDKTDVEQMLESRIGVELVKDLIVPGEMVEYLSGFNQLEVKDAA